MAFCFVDSSVIAAGLAFNGYDEITSKPIANIFRKTKVWQGQEFEYYWDWNFLLDEGLLAVLEYFYSHVA